MIENHSITFHTNGNIDVIDLSPYLNTTIKKTNINNGQLFLFGIGSTCALTTIEYERGLLKDIKEFYSKLIPYGRHYHHHDTWNDDNGSSHLQASLLKPNLNIPFVNKKLILGTWQQVIFIDFDTSPRDRKVHCQIMGEI